MEGLEFASAKRMLCTIIDREIGRHYYLKTSDALTDEDRTLFTKMLHGQDDNIKDSIRMLSQLLYKHYGQKAVILIDEYDVPLDKAFQNGYYKEMVSLIRGFSGRRSRPMSFYSLRCSLAVFVCQRRAFLQGSIILKSILLWILTMMSSLVSLMMKL